MTAIIIWIIGCFFTVGLTARDKDKPWWADYLLLIAWPFALGVIVYCLIEKILPDEASSEEVKGI